MRQIKLTDEDHAAIAALIKNRRDMHHAYANPGLHENPSQDELSREREMEEKYSGLLFRFNETSHV